MRLFFLYVKDYLCFKEQSFHFVSGEHYEFANHVLRKTKQSEAPTLPSNFYITEAVDSISAIIGNNGSGKTNIGRILAEFVGGRLHEKTEFLVLCDLSNSSHMPELHCIYHLQDEPEVPDGVICHSWEEFSKESVRFWKNRTQSVKTTQKLTERVEELPVFTNCSFLYFSNFYTTQHWGFSKLNFVYDLSTSAYLKNDIQKYRERKIKRHNVSSIANHRVQEIRRMVQLLHLAEQYNFDLSRYKHIFHYPREIKASLRTEILSSLPDAKTEKSDEVGCNWRKQLSAVLEKLRTFLRLKQNNPQALSDNIGIVILGFFLRQCLASNTDKTVQGALSALATSLETASSFDEFLQCLRKFDGRKSDFGDLLKKICHAIESYRNSKQQLAKFIPYSSGVSIQTTFEDIDNLREFLNILFKEPLRELGESIWFYSFSPELSSGEMSLWTMFSHFAEFCQQPGDLPLFQQDLNDRNLIIFLDEVEITIEPNLQRQLIMLVLNFFQCFFRNCHCHLIFASHSPILLSDIPKGNAIFLKREENGSITVNPTSIDTLSNTFGANIYSLYKNAYFMDDGLIGAFAAQWIQKIYKAYGKLIGNTSDTETSCEELSQEDLRELTDAIGEPLIQKQLKTLQSIADANRQ